jgi:hypothetical protein
MNAQLVIMMHRFNLEVDDDCCASPGVSGCLI